MIVPKKKWLEMMAKNNNFKKILHYARANPCSSIEYGKGQKIYEMAT
jgi:hypothetical protein